MRAASSCRVTRLAPCLVRVNTSARRDARVAQQVHQQVALLLALHEVHRCSTVSAVVDCGATSTFAGSFRMPLLSAWISGGIVAEKNSVCRFGGQRRDDLLHVVDEAHVEHAVGLVEHEHLERLVRDEPLAHRGRAAGPASPPGRPRRARSACSCAFCPTPPKITAHVSEVKLPVGLEALADLAGQLARGGEDERADGAAVRGRSRAALGEPLEDGQRERRRLARARLRAAEHVAPGERRRNGLDLDGGGSGVALGLHGAQQGFGELQFVKSHVSRCRVPGPRTLARPEKGRGRLHPRGALPGLQCVARRTADYLRAACSAASFSR